MLLHQALPQKVLAMACPAMRTGENAWPFLAARFAARSALLRRAATETYGLHWKYMCLPFLRVLLRGVNIERDQPQQFLIAHFGQLQLRAAFDHRARELLLGFDQPVDSILDGSATHELVHQH